MSYKDGNDRRKVFEKCNLKEMVPIYGIFFSHQIWQYRAVPIIDNAEVVVVAVDDVSNEERLERIRRHVDPRTVDFVLATREELEACMRQYFREGEARGLANLHEEELKLQK